jgi:hypothetical protein
VHVCNKLNSLVIKNFVIIASVGKTIAAHGLAPQACACAKGGEDCIDYKKIIDVMMFDD